MPGLRPHRFRRASGGRTASGRKIRQPCSQLGNSVIVPRSHDWTNAIPAVQRHVTGQGHGVRRQATCADFSCTKACQGAGALSLAATPRLLIRGRPPMVQRAELNNHEPVPCCTGTAREVEETRISQARHSTTGQDNSRQEKLRDKNPLEKKINGNARQKTRYGTIRLRGMILTCMSLPRDNRS